MYRLKSQVIKHDKVKKDKQLVCLSNLIHMTVLRISKALKKSKDKFAKFRVSNHIVLTRSPCCIREYPEVGSTNCPVNSAKHTGRNFLRGLESPLFLAST